MHELITGQTEDGLLDISRAVILLIGHTFRSKINLDFLDDDEDRSKRSSYTWDDVLTVIERDLVGHKMSRSEYESIWEAVRTAPAQLKDRYLAALTAWRSVMWPFFREELVAEASHDFGNYSFTQFRLREHLEKWPELRRERHLITAGLAKLRTSGSNLKEAIGNLIELKGNEEDTRAALTTIVAARQYHQGESIAELLNAWVSDTAWGQLMTSLWALLPEQYIAPKAIIDLAYLLRQVPLITGSSLDGFVLEEMSGASRARWRRSVAKAIGGDKALKQAATEALLWFAHAREDLLAQFTTLEINDTDPGAAIEPFQSHPSRLVVLRSGSALDLLARKPDPLEANLTNDGTEETASSTSPKSRTWLGDARLEQLLRTTFERAATSMAAEVSSTASSGEENLVGKLLERLRGACEQVTERAAILARETDRVERLTVSLSHRVIGKTEEGNPGLVKERRFSTDVTLILRACRGAKPPFSQRATFIQAKRLRRGTPLQSVHYAVNMTQMEDIANQTSSSFLLAVGPEAMGVTMPIVPAQLLVDRFGAIVKERLMHPDRISRLGKSLADWLVDDVIGLWTGDPREEAVEMASAGAGDHDTILVEIAVAMESVDPEIDDGKR